MIQPGIFTPDGFDHCFIGGGGYQFPKYGALDKWGDFTIFTRPGNPVVAHAKADRGGHITGRHLVDGGCVSSAMGVEKTGVSDPDVRFCDVDYRYIVIIRSGICLFT